MSVICDKDIEGTKPVVGYVVKTDIHSNRTFLNKSCTDFIQYNELDIYSFDLGLSKDYIELSKAEIFNFKLKRISDMAYDIYFEHDDVTIEDSFSIEALPSALYTIEDCMTQYDDVVSFSKAVKKEKSYKIPNDVYINARIK